METKVQPSTSGRLQQKTSHDVPDALYRAVLTSVKQQPTPVRFEASENALEVFRRRYASTKENGDKEAPEEMCRRVARALARVELDYGTSEEHRKEVEEEFYGVLMRKEFTPAGRTLTNAGTPFP